MIKFNSFKCLLLLATLFPSGLMLPAEASTPSVDKVLIIQRYVLNGHTVTIEDGNRCGVTPRVSPEQPGVLERYGCRRQQLEDNSNILQKVRVRCHRLGERQGRRMYGIVDEVLHGVIREQLP